MQKMIEKWSTKEKNEKTGPTKVQMEGIDPQKIFCSANIKKVPRAYKSLNPALLIYNSKSKIIQSILTRLYVSEGAS
jgi:hypothetical protein